LGHPPHGKASSNAAERQKIAQNLTWHNVNSTMTKFSTLTHQAQWKIFLVKLNSVRGAQDLSVFGTQFQDLSSPNSSPHANGEGFKPILYMACICIHRHGIQTKLLPRAPFDHI